MPVPLDSRALARGRPLSDRAGEAVSACTRALAGAEDADALLGRAHPATLGGLRAYADRLALRRRFHTGAVHRRHQPTESPASDLFAALELARLDALGARWLAGIGKNLVSHPGAENDGPRWLAFEVLSERAAPGEKAAFVARVRQALPISLVSDLRALVAHLSDQDSFAAAAASWARRAAPHLPPDVTETAGVNPFPLGMREVVRKLPKRGDPGGTSAPLTKAGTQPASSENT